MFKIATIVSSVLLFSTASSYAEESRFPKKVNVEAISCESDVSTVLVSVDDDKKYQSFVGIALKSVKEQSDCDFSFYRNSFLVKSEAEFRKFMKTEEDQIVSGGRGVFVIDFNTEKSVQVQTSSVVLVYCDDGLDKIVDVLPAKKFKEWSAKASGDCSVKTFTTKKEMLGFIKSKKYGSFSYSN